VEYFLLSIAKCLQLSNPLFLKTYMCVKEIISNISALL